MKHYDWQVPLPFLLTLLIVTRLGKGTALVLGLVVGFAGTIFLTSDRELLR